MYRSPVNLFVVTAVICLGCSPKIKTAFISSQDLVVRSAEPLQDVSSSLGRCNDPLDYAPDPRYPEYTPAIPLRLVVHIMDATEGEYNLNREDGRRFVHEVLDKCNARLLSNTKMNLPPGNTTPVLSVPWYYVLVPDPDIPGNDGIYFHSDPDLFYYIHGKNTNRTSREVVHKYAVKPDSMLNIFFMPHHPDSVKSPTYFAPGTGITLGSSIKIAQVFSPSLPPESCVGLLNHEVGHALGLSHAWISNDGCDDTPPNPNCWYYTNDPPCDSLVSNNMMDYNAWQAALTPCQIGRVMRNFANLASRVRKFAQPFWCTKDVHAVITIRDSIHWNAAKDLGSDIVIANGGVLRLSCRLSLPSDASIIVSPGGKLILDNCRIHNACGEQWNGIEIQRQGRKAGTVEVYGNPRIEDVVHPVDLVGDR